MHQSKSALSETHAGFALLTRLTFACVVFARRTQSLQPPLFFLAALMLSCACFLPTGLSLLMMSLLVGLLACVWFACWIACLRFILLGLVL